MVSQKEQAAEEFSFLVHICELQADKTAIFMEKRQ
jgi:hypothetical protein